MQQTVDVLTKDQTAVDAATILVSGLSYFSYAAVATHGDLAVADADATTTTAACGLSSCYSSVAVLETTEADADADVTTIASNLMR